MQWQGSKGCRKGAGRKVDSTAQNRNHTTPGVEGVRDLTSQPVLLVNTAIKRSRREQEHEAVTGAYLLQQPFIETWRWAEVIDVEKDVETACAQLLLDEARSGLVLLAAITEENTALFSRKNMAYILSCVRLPAEAEYLAKVPRGSWGDYGKHNAELMSARPSSEVVRKKAENAKEDTPARSPHEDDYPRQQRAEEKDESGECQRRCCVRL